MRTWARRAASRSWQSCCIIFTFSLAFAACTQPGGTGQPRPDNGNANVADPSEPDEGSGLPAIDVTEPERTPTAWELVAAGIADDGTVSKDVALQAFALTLGDIPGVTPPTADVIGAECGSAALRWVTRHADSLTAEELAAIEAALQPEGTPQSRVSGATAAQLLGERSCTIGHAAVTEDDDGAEQYRPILDQELAKLEQAFGRALGIPVYLTLGIGKAGSDTLAWASPQSSGDCGRDPATSCRVELLVNREEVNNEVKLRAVLSHELCHCFQATWLSATDSLLQPDWAAEGFPDYAAGQLNPTAERASFNIYTLTPLRWLYDRTYDGQGFFSHLQALGIDVFGRYPDAFKLSTSDDIFADLIGPAEAQFGSTWASSYALDPGRGDAWDMPYAPADATSGAPSGILVAGKRFLANAEKATTRIAHIDFAADIVRFEASGGMNGRISWDGGGEVLLADIDGQAFCRKADGCECPPGTRGFPPQTPIPSVGAMVSASGTTVATSLELIGASLAEYCRAEAQPEPPPSEGVDPCLVGTWESSEWVLPGPTPALDGRGGSGAVVTIHATGLAEWDFEFMQPITSSDPQINVVTEQYTRGSATGRIATADGEWTVSETDTSALRGFMIDNVLGQIPLAGGPGLFVLLREGSYTCSGDLLSYTTTDPVEDATISVTLHKQ